MQFKRKLLLNAFVDAHVRSKNQGYIRVLHLEHGWTVACGDTSLDTVLMRPGGSTSFDGPEQALRVLASAGIRCAVIEWDGLEAHVESAEGQLA